MEPSSDTRMDCTESTSDISPSETPPKSRRIVSFYPTSTGSTALWPDDLPIGTDALTYPQGHSNHQLGSVTGLHAWIIEARSPLIAAAFESSVSGKRLHLDSLDPGTVLPFVRFLYTGYYAQIGDWEDVPTSVWMHCRMYYLGHLYDLADLKSQAYVNVLRQCEFGCSSPCMPIDLCQAIDFVYRHLSGHDAISDALVQYCVTRCLSHKLHENAEFRNVAFFVRAFHQDLTKACRDRDYEDESAAIIIQLPYMNYAPATYASTEHPPISRFEDIIHHYHSNDRFDNIPPKKRQRVTFDERQTSPTKVLKLQESTEQPVSKLALRQAPEKSAAVAFQNQSTLECEAKLPDVDATPEAQQCSSQKSHQQQPQMIITSRTSSQQVAPTQRPPAREVTSLAQMMIAKAKEEEGLRMPSAVETFSNAQRMMANLTEKGKVQMREGTLRNMSEEQIQQALARKQDLLFQHIYEQKEQEVMNELMVAQAPDVQQQQADLPLRPAFPATSNTMEKQPGRPPFPSSGRVLEDEAIHKDENLPIWKRRDMTGTNSGLSQAFETLRSQEKQSQRDQTIEPAVSQKQSGPDLYQPKKDWKQRKAMDAKLKAFHKPNPSAKSTQDDPFKDCPEPTTPIASITPSAPPRVIHYPSVAKPLNAGTNNGNHALQDYQMQLMLLEQQNKKRLLMARQYQDSMTCSPPSTNMQPDVPNDYQMQLRLLEQQNAKRLLGTRQYQDLMAHPLDAGNNTQPGVPKEDRQMQLRLLEQQNKRRLLGTQQEQDSMTHPCGPTVNAGNNMQPAVPAAVSKLQHETSHACSPPMNASINSGNHALQDYQVQALLLEQQNKKRLLMARQEQDSMARPLDTGNNMQPDVPAAVPELQHKTSHPCSPPTNAFANMQPAEQEYYQLQLRLLEGQNKKRLLMARQEQDSMSHPYCPLLNTSTEMQSALPQAASKLQNETSSESCPRREYTPPGVRNRRDSGSMVVSSAVDAATEPSTPAGASASKMPPVPQPSESQRVALSDSNERLRLRDEKIVKKEPMTKSHAPAPRATSRPVAVAPPGSDRRQGRVRRVDFDFDAFVEADRKEFESLGRRNDLSQSTEDGAHSGSEDATRNMSRPAAAAPGSDHKQSDFTFASQNEGENDILADFDFDAFLETNVMDGAFEFDESPIEHEDLGRHNSLFFESDSEHGAASDSDAQSWVDVAMVPTSSSGGMSPSDAATAAISGAPSVPVPSPTRRSPSHSDSEWELC
ncbi:hypothetical protein Q7P36_011250 [Cladosporium allicinum]